MQNLIEFAAAHGPDSGVVPPGYADLPADLAKEALTTAAAVTEPSADATHDHPNDTAPGALHAAVVESRFGRRPYRQLRRRRRIRQFDTVGHTRRDTDRRGPDGSEARSREAPRGDVDRWDPFDKAGAQLSGHASWAVLLALTLFCLLGLLFSPVRDTPWVSKRITWLRARPWIAKPLARCGALPRPWRRSTPGMTP